MQPSALAKPAKPLASAEGALPVLPQRSIPTARFATQKTVSVQHGDSLWRLALHYLGHGNRWPELLVANRWIANPNRIRTGSKLDLPASASIPAAVRTANSPASDAAIPSIKSRVPAVLVQTSVIKVRKGDNLWNLAKTVLGHSSSWRCLAAANPDIRDADRIYIGQTLRLPSSCRP